MSTNLRPLPATPPDAIPKIVREKVILGEHAFLIDRPGESDDLLAHPAVRQAFAADEYLPYWADLWPAARMLAKAVLAEPWPEVRGQRTEVRSQGAAGGVLTSDLCPLTSALEVGCGLGLPGIAALARGLRVIFSDYDATAVGFAANNARLNGLTNFVELPFDWRAPPADLAVDVVLASDLTYEARHVEPLVALVAKVLKPGGLCLWTDQDRPPAAALKAELGRLGWPVETKVARAGEPGGQRYKGTLYRIRRPG
ncbi:MAG TPA: methyltransferase [Gemmataceae bacterium]|jgi:SAM-dependent methyltransferase